MSIGNAQELHEAITLAVTKSVKETYTFADVGSQYFLEDTGWTADYAQEVFTGWFLAKYVHEAQSLIELYDDVDSFIQANYKFATEDCSNMTMEKYIQETTSASLGYACYEPWDEYLEILNLDASNALNISQEQAQKCVNYLYDYYSMEDEAA